MLASAAYQLEERRIGCCKISVNSLPEGLAGKIICSRSAPFEYIQPKLRIIVSLVGCIAEIDNGSSAIIEGRNISRGRSGRSSRCGENTSKQHGDCLPNKREFHGWMHGNRGEMTG